MHLQAQRPGRGSGGCHPGQANVLSLLGLESQLVDGSFSPDNHEDIDYLNAEHKLEAMKKLSKANINRIISE